MGKHGNRGHHPQMDGPETLVKIAPDASLDALSQAALSRRDVIRGGAAAAITAAFSGFGVPSRAFAQEAPEARIASIGWVARAADKPLERWEFTRRAPGPKDVLIDILYCGICHSDIHQARSNLGPQSTYPVVPGHEIVGRVRHVGASVKRFKVGDVAGVATYVDSADCDHGMEQYCNPVFTYGSPDGQGGVTHGGYANNIVVDEDYVFSIPDGMDLRRAAPILCAGTTTAAPMTQWKVGKGTRVGIVGLGGLGHMAVKLAVDRGADVTVFTTSPGKIDDAKRMGAKEVVVWPVSQREAVGRLGTFDFILTTVPYTFDMNPFLLMLDIDGVMSNVGLLQEANANYVFVNLRRLNLTGSIVGTIRDTQELLEHCHRKKIMPEVEVIPIDKVNEAYDRVMNKDVKFRFVIDMSTLS